MKKSIIIILFFFFLNLSDPKQQCTSNKSKFSLARQAYIYKANRCGFIL